MTTHQHPNPNDRTLPADAPGVPGIPGAIRPLSPGILAVALLLALTTSVATAGVVDGSDPTRIDRREAPRELTVRWLTSAVAKAVRDLASPKAQAGAVTRTIRISQLAMTPAPASGVIPGRDDVDPTIPEGWPAQGLLNVPPPATP